MFECNPATQFDDADLPSGVCDDMIVKFSSCMANVAVGWAIGGDHVRLLTNESNKFECSYIL